MAACLYMYLTMCDCLQSMKTREDHVVTVNHPDGTVVVEHADGTRITTFWREITVTVAGDSSFETGKPPPYICLAFAYLLSHLVHVY